LVMEYVDGEPLSSTLAREGPLEPARVAAIARQVAEALAAAHALGIVHRDLKPDNVMLAVGRDGRETVKVVDFGIAKAMEGVTQQVTRTGYRIGTPAYMSPEQIRGDTLDGRSDLYSLGCILFELLTGHPPFEGEVGEIVVGRRLTEQPPHPRDLDAGVPKALDEITVRLLARSPDDRFASAEDLLATLAATPVGESGMWRLPFARRPARQTHTPTPRGITISGVEQRLPSGQLRTPPPVPLSPAVASPITVGTAAAPAAAASGVRRAPRDRRRHRPLVLASGGLLAVVAVAGVLLTYQDSDAPANATVASHDSLPATAPGGVAPVPPAATRAAPSVSGAADPTAVDAAPSPATPSTRDTGSAIRDTPATRVPVTPPSPAPRPAPPRVTTAPRETAGAAAPDRSVAVVPTPPSAPTAPVSPPAAAPPTSSSPPAAGSPDSEAAAAAADRAGIQQVIGDYMRAFDARDAAAARRVYPDVDTRAWEARQLTNWSAKLVEQPAVTLRGATAEASFAYELAFFHPQTGMSRTTLAAHATLQRTAAGWRIQRLDAAPRR
ncbi:MAG TPA: protein kinase, partial [Gemmatimonadaceae bacterium]